VIQYINDIKYSETKLLIIKWFSSKRGNHQVIAWRNLSDIVCFGLYYSHELKLVIKSLFVNVRYYILSNEFFLGCKLI
jgi:hypothetical protein